MLKKLLLLGLVSGLLSGILSIIYTRVAHYLGVDFSVIITPVKMIVSSVLAWWPPSGSGC